MSERSELIHEHGSISGAAGHRCAPHGADMAQSAADVTEAH